MEAVLFVQIDIETLSFLFQQQRETVLFDAIPSLGSVNITPAKVEPGRTIGKREAVSCTFIDHLHVFDTDPFEAGTFWTKFRARFPALQGCLLKVIRGTSGQALEDMDTREYVIDSFQPLKNGATIVAKDPLTLLQASAAQAPAVNTGEVTGDLAFDDTEFTLSPAGIGDLEYPASGRLCIGGKEIVPFTRAADVVTMSSRGLNLDGVGLAHSDGSKAQIVLRYDEATPSEIISDLLENYTEVDPAWIDQTDWQEQVDEYIGRLYGGEITEPTAVSKLLNELCEQVGLVIYWDALEKQIRLKPLTPTLSPLEISPENIMQDSFDRREQTDLRVSQVWTYYAQRDPTQSLDETSNYQRIAVKLADNAANYRQSAIKKIFSRWIGIGGRTTADRLNDIIVARYKVAPQVFSFDLYRDGNVPPGLGTQAVLSHWSVVDGDGTEVPVYAQITSAQHKDDAVSYDAEEVNFDESIDGVRFVIIDADAMSVNLRDMYDQIYSSVTSEIDVVFVVESGVKLGCFYRIAGGLSTDDFAVDVGDWPEGPNSIAIINNGAIRGGGAAGASSVSSGSPSQDGSDGQGGLYTRIAITLKNNGEISGGGGAGAGDANYGGGAGAGMTFFSGVPKYAPGGVAYLPSYPASPPNGQASTYTTGGAGGGGFAGAGGDLGEDGEDSNIASGGSAGPAIDGDSYVTLDTEGTINGPRIN